MWFSPLSHPLFRLCGYFSKIGCQRSYGKKKREGVVSVQEGVGYFRKQPQEFGLLGSQERRGLEPSKPTAAISLQLRLRLRFFGPRKCLTPPERRATSPCDGLGSREGVGTEGVLRMFRFWLYRCFSFCIFTKSKKVFPSHVSLSAAFLICMNRP